MIRLAFTTALLMAAAGCAHAQTAPSQPAAPAETPQPDCSASEHHQLDFWIGEWDVYRTGSDTLAGRSVIQSADGGCVVTEQWTSARVPFTGRSLNLYDRTSGLWQQFWVDNQGDLIHFKGGLVNGSMQLTDQNDVGPDQPTPAYTRLTLIPNADGTIRQHGEASSDRGQTWTTRYDLTYRRRR